MNKPRDIRFSFDNVDVACRFVDAVFAIPNMGGVTIHLEDAPQEVVEGAGEQQTTGQVSQ